ncbi:hypothetical protein DPMN_050677 [Dreissena polymorpha]|uniref:Uncharacterized protein n=1 Tax=Dreissena polymorpha TaxID=45954 RepID=A0A9D4CIB9_DREPO|nr:hypothetical protein DPMN_050677 [Dreissena polymorpha]
MQGECRKLKKIFPLLARCAACIASLDAISCRPEPQNGFPSTLSVLGAAVFRHFHYLDMATPRNHDLYLCPRSTTPVFYPATSAVPVPLPAMQ